MSSVKINAGDVKRADMLFVDPFQVIVKEELRGRRMPPTDEQIIALAESMLQVGQRQAVECRKVDDNRLQLSFGFTRMAAARLIREGFTDSDGIPQRDEAFTLKVMLANGNDETSFVANIVENCHRNATTDLDDAFNQQKLRDRYGKTDAEIAKLYGDKGGQRVSRLKTLLSAPSDVQAMVQAGEMSTPAVAELMELPEENRAEAIEHAKANGNGKVSAPAIRSQVRDHHLRDEGNGQVSKPKKKPLSVAELRKFIADELDDAVIDTPLRKFLETLTKFMAGERTAATMKSVLNDTIKKRRGHDVE